MASFQLLGYLPLEGFTCHPNALPYFLHWISLITLESLEEVQQAVQASHGVYSRHRVTAEATPCSEQELKFTLVITGGTPSFRSADGVALSRSSNISKREYIGEVTEICGAILTVSIVWPTSSDDSSRKNILKGMWYLYKFPSLVGYRRTSAALKALQDATKYGQNVLKGIVSSFCVDDPSSQDSCERVVKETIVEHLISGQLMRGEELEEGVIKVEETKVEATGAGELEAPGGVGVGVGVEEGDRCRQRIFVACVLLRDCRFVSNIFTLWLFEHKNVEMVFFLLCC